MASATQLAVESRFRKKQVFELFFQLGRVSPQESKIIDFLLYPTQSPIRCYDLSRSIGHPPHSLASPVELRGYEHSVEKKELRVHNKPIGASPGRDYVLTRMVLLII